MDIELITLFKFTYIPFEKGSIRFVDVFITAKDRKEAELIALEKNYEFFDQSCTVNVAEVLQGFREIK
jgi:hypothetical protein